MCLDHYLKSTAGVGKTQEIPMCQSNAFPSANHAQEARRHVTSAVNIGSPAHCLLQIADVTLGRVIFFFSPEETLLNYRKM